MICPPYGGPSPVGPHRLFGQLNITYETKTLMRTKREFFLSKQRKKREKCFGKRRGHGHVNRCRDLLNS